MRYKFAYKFANPLLEKIASLSITQLRWLPVTVKVSLQRRQLWGDIIQEAYTLALEAYSRGLRGEREVSNFCQRGLYACLKAYGYAKAYGWHLREVPKSEVKKG